MIEHFFFARVRRARRGDGQRALIKADGEEPLLLLVWKVDQLTKLRDQRLRRGVAPLGRLHRELMLAVAEAHHLNKPPGRLPARPIGADLLEHIELIAQEVMPHV